MSADIFPTYVADLCRNHPARPKWVLVPAHAIGLTLGDRLARDGCSWANLRFVTPLDLATRMAAPFLLERGVDPSEETLGPALVMRLLLDLPAGSGYFRPMAEHASMADALWRTLRELRYAGVRAADLAAAPFSGIPAKQAELIALLSAYEAHLDAARVADMPLVFEEATRRTGWSPIAPDALVTELPGRRWPPVVRRFLDSLPGIRVSPFETAADVPHGQAKPAEARLRGTELEGTTLEGTSLEDAALDSGLEGAAPTDALRRGARQRAEVEIFHAGGRDAEIDEIFRRIVRSGLTLDQVELACSGAVQPSLLRDKASRLGWPVTLGRGLPGTETRPGRLLLRFCDWVESGFEAASLRRLLQSGDCWARAFKASKASKVSKDAASRAARDTMQDATRDVEADFSPGQAARLLLKAEAAWGRDTYSRALTRLADEFERRAANPESDEDERAWNGRRGRQTRVLLAWVTAVLDRIPVSGGESGNVVPLAALTDAAINFLDENAPRWSEHDAAALVALTAALADLRSLGSYQCSVAMALRFLRERATSLTVARERPRPGHLHVTALREAGYDGRRLVFVAGLDEGAIFPAAVEDPVLLDAERRAIGPLLASSRERQADEVQLVLSRLAAVNVSAARVCFSFSCRDTREFRDTFPSWVVLDAFRQRQGDSALTYRDLKRYLGEPVSAVPPRPAEALADSTWWLSHACGQPSAEGRPGASAARDAVLGAFPWLARGVEAAARRESAAFTEFDGLVPEAGAALDPSRTGLPISPTTLEDAAKCPLRFFMRRGLGVRPIDEGKADQDAWLAPTTKGSELHELYARLMRSLRKEKRTASVAVDGPRLQAWGRERLEALRAEMPPPSEEVFARESREFLEDLEAFLASECEGRHGANPIGFEVAFGFPLRAGEEEPLATADPLVIDIGGARRLVIHGRIDRINRVKPGEYEVVDYKGSYWRDDWQGDFAGGTRLQHALYGAAAAQLLRRVDARARVVRGTYLFPGVRGHRARKVIPAPSRGKLIAVLRDLADAIASGAFAPANQGSPCTFCEYKAACHAERSEQARVKVENEGNAVLAAYRKLRNDHA